MANINRDYLVILDVKTGNITAPSMYFFNTDKKTNNIYVQLIVKETIVNANPIENATDYSVSINVIKPGGIMKQMDGVLVNESESIYEFDLPADFTNLGGGYQLEFFVKCIVSPNEEQITSSPTTYTVNESILTGLNADVEDDENYPILLKLIEEVKMLQGSGGSGGVDTSGLASKEYVEQRISAIELTPGPKGDKGDKGDPGENGQDGLTTQVAVNGTTYTHTNGLITLPNYPTVPTKTSQLTNDSGYATETYVTSKIAEASLSGGEVDLSGYATKDELPTKTSQLTNDSGFITAADVHTHANKTVLDGITSTKVSNWDAAYTHSQTTHFSGNYNDLTNKPTIPTAYTHPSTHPASMITGLASVATSGSYNDLTNKPSIPSIDGLASTTYVDNKVAGIVGSAPETLDTLNELAAALGDDPNFATTVATEIGTKVDKVEGKGLSTNDLTNTLKSNYDTAYTHSQTAHAPTNAEANVQADWNVTDTSSDAYIKNKPTIPSIPSSLPANGGNADTVDNFHLWKGTQSQYDAITTKDANTIYMITG